MHPHIAVHTCIGVVDQSLSSIGHPSSISFTYQCKIPLNARATVTFRVRKGLLAVTYLSMQAPPLSKNPRNYSGPCIEGYLALIGECEWKRPSWESFQLSWGQISACQAYTWFSGKVRSPPHPISEILACFFAFPTPTIELPLLHQFCLYTYIIEKSASLIFKH